MPEIPLYAVVFSILKISILTSSALCFRNPYYKGTMNKQQWFIEVNRLYVRLRCVKKQDVYEDNRFNDEMNMTFTYRYNEVTRLTTCIIPSIQW